MHCKVVRNEARRPSRVARALAALIAPLLIGLGGCSGDSGPAGPVVPTSPIASYLLSTVDSKALPITVFSDTGYVVEFTAGAITLSADKSYSRFVTSRETVDGNVSLYVDSEAGTWVQASGSGAIMLTPQFASSRSALWSGLQLTVTQSDGVFKYLRAP